MGTVDTVYPLTRNHSALASIHACLIRAIIFVSRAVEPNYLIKPTQPSNL